MKCKKCEEKGLPRGLKIVHCCKCGSYKSTNIENIMCNQCSEEHVICSVCGESLATSNFKERFIKEYDELNDRIFKLEIMLAKYRHNQLDFTPRCSYDLLNGQLKAMNLYLSYLKERSVIEEIPLKKEWKAPAIRELNEK